MAVTWKKLACEADVITKALLTEQGDIIYASAASTPAALAHSTAGFVLQTGGDGANPSWLDPQGLHVPHHAATHKNGADDEILLNEFGEPTAAVPFDGQQATNLVLHTVANAGARPTAVVGKGIFQTDELAVYVCTVSV